MSFSHRTIGVVSHTGFGFKNSYLWSNSSKDLRDIEVSDLHDGSAAWCFRSEFYCSDLALSSLLQVCSDKTNSR